jgi:hypothetical protein
MVPVLRPAPALSDKMISRPGAGASLMAGSKLSGLVLAVKARRGCPGVRPGTLLGRGAGDGWPAGQVVAWMALRMTLATAPGSEIMDRCGALISVMRACAVLAMASCSARGMA